MNRPVIVPWTTLPFLSSMVTVSLFNFMRKLARRHSSVSKNAELEIEEQTYRTNFILANDRCSTKRWIWARWMRFGVWLCLPPLYRKSCTSTVDTDNRFYTSSSSSSPETSAFSCSALRMICSRSCSSVSETAFGYTTVSKGACNLQRLRTFILTTSDPPCSSIVLWMASIARSKRSTAAYCSPDQLPLASITSISPCP